MDQPPQADTSRVAVTPAAAEMIRRLREENGPLMFHQSGGCCDGSAPMCFPLGDFITGDADQFLGEIDAGTPEPVPVWMSKEQFAYWRHTHLTIDLVPGRGAGFSLEAPTGFRFLIRSRLLSEEEMADLDPQVGAAVGVQPQPLPRPAG
ncbi:hypothetical protein SAMN04488543_2982 [Friedmanniella luteola]|uniref:UDP-glucose 4-epimerase n=1 Tax=Friedmanniella luteola TaxID=546871 RepID=A0A1H1XFV5_9ACTN|nr:DUF779 domain-containing protein [Friedmanniella luteola]SDT08032.1 hypothetical protein SAMN04488543_2982 [Friedmanniella luteola]